jgi:hypothetical protein
VWAPFVFKRSYPCCRHDGYCLCGVAIQTIIHMHSTLQDSVEHISNSTVCTRPVPTRRALHAVQPRVIGKWEEKASYTHSKGLLAGVCWCLHAGSPEEQHGIPGGDNQLSIVTLEVRAEMTTASCAHGLQISQRPVHSIQKGISHMSPLVLQDSQCVDDYDDSPSTCR